MGLFLAVYGKGFGTWMCVFPLQVLKFVVITCVDVKAEKISKTTYGCLELTAPLPLHPPVMMMMMMIVPVAWRFIVGCDTETTFAKFFLSPVLLVTSWLNFYSANCVKSNFWFYISCTSDVYFSTQYISLLVWKRLSNFWWFRVVVVVVYQARKIDLFCCFFFYSLLYFMAHCFFLFLVGCCIWRVGWLPLCLIAAPPYITFPVWFDRSTYWTSTCYFL